MFISATLQLHHCVVVNSDRSGNFGYNLPEIWVYEFESLKVCWGYFYLFDAYQVFGEVLIILPMLTLNAKILYSCLYRDLPSMK